MVAEKPLVSLAAIDSFGRAFLPLWPSSAVASALEHQNSAAERGRAVPGCVSVRLARPRNQVHHLTDCCQDE